MQKNDKNVLIFQSKDEMINLCSTMYASGFKEDFIKDPVVEELQWTLMWDKASNAEKSFLGQVIIRVEILSNQAGNTQPLIFDFSQFLFFLKMILHYEPREEDVDNKTSVIFVKTAYEAASSLVLKGIDVNMTDLPEVLAKFNLSELMLDLLEGENSLNEARELMAEKQYLRELRSLSS